MKEERLIHNKPKGLRVWNAYHSLLTSLLSQENFTYILERPTFDISLYTMAFGHGIVQVNPENVNDSKKCFLKSHITRGNTEKKQIIFQRSIPYLLLDRDDNMNYFDFFIAIKTFPKTIFAFTCIWSSNLIKESFAGVWLNGALSLDYSTINKKSLWHKRNMQL